MEDNNQLMSFVPTMHWTPSSCIALCSVVCLLRSGVVLGEYGFLLAFDDVERFKIDFRVTEG